MKCVVLKVLLAVILRLQAAPPVLMPQVAAVPMRTDVNLISRPLLAMIPTLKIIIPIQAPGVMELPAIQLRMVPAMREKAVIGTCLPRGLAKRKDANWAIIIRRFSK